MSRNMARFDAILCSILFSGCAVSVGVETATEREDPGADAQAAGSSWGAGAAGVGAVGNGVSEAGSGGVNTTLSDATVYDASGGTAGADSGSSGMGNAGSGGSAGGSSQMCPISGEYFQKYIAVKDGALPCTATSCSPGSCCWQLKACVPL